MEQLLPELAGLGVLQSLRCGIQGCVSGTAWRGTQIAERSNRGKEEEVIHVFERFK
jgi:hypothetical protein